MKHFIFLLILPSLLLAKENFEHKQQLMIENHIYAIDHIVNDLWGGIPEKTHADLIYHIESLKVLIYD
jgi:hypothetical protein